MASQFAETSHSGAKAPFILRCLRHSSTTLGEGFEVAPRYKSTFETRPNQAVLLFTRAKVHLDSCYQPTVFDLARWQGNHDPVAGRIDPPASRCRTSRRKVRTPAIEDAYTREMPAIEADTFLPALRVVQMLKKLRPQHGDIQGSELSVSTVLLQLEIRYFFPEMESWIHKS